MFILEVENVRSEKLRLTQNESKYQVVSVEGLNPPSAEIFTNTVAGLDGGLFKSSKLQMRNLVLNIKIRGDVEKNRIALYKFFRTKYPCKIYYTNESRRVYIEGYCEAIENDLFTDNQTMQVSIICPDPYFKSVLLMYTDISKIFANFEFPFAFGAKNSICEASTMTDDAIIFSGIDINRRVSVTNNGEIDTGVIITLTAHSDNIINPVIYEIDDKTFFKLNTTMMEGDVIIIDTNKGHKSVKMIRGVEEINMIRYMATGSTWFQLRQGDNVFTSDADANVEDLFVVFERYNLYEGV